MNAAALAIDASMCCSGARDTLVNHKKLFRLYREEKLTVRKRGGRKRAIGTRAPMLIPMAANDRWSLDFVSDQLTDGRRFRVLTVVEFLNETLFSSLAQARSALSNWRSDYNDHRPHSGIGWLTPAEFAQTINPRQDAVLRSRNVSAPQPAATAPNTATQNRWSELKIG